MQIIVALQTTIIHNLACFAFIDEPLACIEHFVACFFAIFN